jgi:hypothetical protein
LFAPWGDVTVARNCNRDCVVDQTNAAFEASSGRLIVGIQDDFFPPEHWDTLLLEALVRRQYPAEEFTIGDSVLDECVHVLCSSGQSIERERELMIAGMVTRPVFERRGYVLDPDFESMFADNWWAFENRRDAAAGTLEIIERFDIQFEHRHPVFGTGKMDAAYAQENRSEAYLRGSVVYHQKVTGKAVMVMCLPGESFRSEIVGSRFQLIEDVKARTDWGLVAPHWCYTSNVYATRIELAKEALRFPSITLKDDLVLWVDDDNDLRFEQLAMLIEDLNADPDLGVVVGWCWCDHTESENSQARTWVMSCGRQNPDDLECLRFSGEDFDKAIERGSMLISSDDIGTHNFWSGMPVVLMRRSVLEQLGPLAFAPILDPRVKDGFTSEDTSFFLNAARAGVKCAVDIRAKVPHVKWRAIEPQYIPLSERAEVERVKAGFTPR